MGSYSWKHCSKGGQPSRHQQPLQKSYCQLELHLNRLGQYVVIEKHTCPIWLMIESCTLVAVMPLEFFISIHLYKLVSCPHCILEVHGLITTMRHIQQFVLMVTIFKEWEDDESIPNMVWRHCKRNRITMRGYLSLFETGVVQSSTVCRWCPAQSQYNLIGLLRCGHTMIPPLMCWKGQ